ncbi:MAG: hypothetical protein Q7J72_04020 [Candidatus Omnitrophota bacterium]|nr:hypothetical protein [Candidatus Omnitrophota bacterium]
MQYRKFTRLKNYDYSTNGYYFVTICTAMKKPWLEKYKTAVEAILKDLPKRFTGINIDFYSIVSDHLHVIFTLNNANAALGEVVRTFKALVTKSTGYKPFWEWNYYEHIIRDENALYSIRKYILENPLKEELDWDNIYSGINAAATNKTNPFPDNPQPRSGAIYRANNRIQHIPAIRSGAIHRTNSDATHRANKGISLIIAVFAMMLFSVLGWTLVRIQSTDFESNVSTGNLNSERALNLAEAGAEWVLQRLNINGGFRTDSTNGYPLGYAQHSISPGQYRVSCLDGTGDDFGKVIITSNGYVPSAANYNTTRQIRLKIQVGSLTKAVMTQVPDEAIPEKGLFDWSAAIAGHTVTINGDINAGHYSGDGDANPDEAGQDYGTAPMLPPGAAGSQRDFTTTYPLITMEWFYGNADQRWPDSNIVTAQITNIQNGGQRIRVDANIFTNMNNQALCSNGIADCADWYNDNNKWRTITAVGSGGSRADLNESIAGIWQIGDTVKLVRRFASGMGGINDGIWYIGRLFEGGPAVDTLIDVTNNNRDLDNTYIICEGSIIIKGDQRLRMRLSGPGATTRYPRLATQSGNIISTDTPLGATEDEKIGQRIISGLIYSELGEVNFNYLRPQTTGSAAYRGNLVYGEQVTLDGRISINYLPGLVSTNGFTFAPGATVWDEE